MHTSRLRRVRMVSGLVRNVKRFIFGSPMASKTARRNHALNVARSSQKSAMCRKLNKDNRNHVVRPKGSAAKIAQNRTVMRHHQALRPVSDAFLATKKKKLSEERRRTRSETVTSGPKTVEGRVAPKTSVVTSAPRPKKSAFLGTREVQESNESRKIERLCKAQGQLMMYVQAQIVKNEREAKELQTGIDKLKLQLDAHEDSKPGSCSGVSSHRTLHQSNGHFEHSKDSLSQEELAKLAKECLADQHHVTRTFCHAQQRVLRLVKQKLVATERALASAKQERETLERRLERKQRRSLMTNHAESSGLYASQSRGTQKSETNKSFKLPPTPVRKSSYLTKSDSEPRTKKKKLEVSPPPDTDSATIFPIVLLIDNRPPQVTVRPAIEVPRFRVVDWPESSVRKKRFEEEEDLDDDTYDRRHSKLENEEKRIVRWDRKRQREEQLRLKLQESPRYRTYVHRVGSHIEAQDSSDDETFDPAKIERVEILKRVPHNVQKRYMVEHRIH